VAAQSSQILVISIHHHSRKSVSKAAYCLAFLPAESHQLCCLLCSRNYFSQHTQLEADLQVRVSDGQASGCLFDGRKQPYQKEATAPGCGRQPHCKWPFSNRD